MTNRADPIAPGIWHLLLVIGHFQEIADFAETLASMPRLP